MLHKGFVLTSKCLLTTFWVYCSCRSMNLSFRHRGLLCGSQSWASAGDPPASQAFSMKISAGWIGFQGPLLSRDSPNLGNRGLSWEITGVINKMAIFFLHNSMLLHYQILSEGQHLILEVLDVNERCFACSHWGLNQQVLDSCWLSLGEAKGWVEARGGALHKTSLAQV